MSRIRILIADDHALVRSGLRALLSAHSDLEVVGEAEDGTVVEESCRRLAPDVVLLDLTMPGLGGIAVIGDARRAAPRTKVLVLTMHEDEAYARQAARAGAAGYVLKKALATELVKAIRTVYRGSRYVDPVLEAAFFDPDPRLPDAGPRTGGADSISPREREVVSLVALGNTNAEIAAHLHISVKTVETHRARILEKLGLRSRADLVRFAIDHGLMRR